MKLKLKRKYGVVFYVIPIIILVGLLIYEISYATKKVDIASIAYKESSDIAYKVRLKKNTYYETEYLDENSSYIASLIDDFVLDYKYLNTFSEKMKYTLTYNVTADLKVYDANNDKKPIYTKKYTLIEDKTVEDDSKIAKLDINDEIINYDEYNRIVTELKREVVPNATLVINFNTSFKGKSQSVSKDIVSNKTSSLSIPISQKTIDVDLKKSNSSDSKTITDSRSLSKPVILLIAGTVLLLIVALIYYVTYLINTAEKKSKYEQKVNKILREFDRAITEAKGKLRIDRSANTIEIKDFMELLDVHDNLSIPIVYYRINSTKSIFIVKNESDIYYYVIKSDDFE